MLNILETVNTCFKLDPDVEFTMEANPGTATKETLSVYKRNGVDRLSIGLQSANNDELETLGRAYDAERFLSMYQGAKEAGFYLVEVMERLKIDLSEVKTVELSRRLHDIVTGNAVPDAVLEATRETMDRIFLAGADARIPSRNQTDNKDGEALGNCPKCGKPVYERDKLYGCSDRACGFALFKDNRYFASMKKSLTKKMVRELLKDGKTYVPDLYSRKKDKTFGATVVMDAGDRYPSFSLTFDHK